MLRWSKITTTIHTPETFRLTRGYWIAVLFQWTTLYLLFGTWDGDLTLIFISAAMAFIAMAGVLHIRGRTGWGTKTDRLIVLFGPVPVLLLAIAITATVWAIKY